MELDICKYNVYYNGVSGGKIVHHKAHKSIGFFKNVVHDLKPKIVFIQLGSNDLSNPSVDVQDLLDTLFDFCFELKSMGVRTIIIGKHWGRFCGQKYARNMSQEYERCFLLGPYGANEAKIWPQVHCEKGWGPP